MPPKKPAGSTFVYLVIASTGVDSAHASIESANARVIEAKSEGKITVKVEVQQLVGGTINVESGAPEKEPRTKAKSVKVEKVDENDAPEANTIAKKTKSAAEQRVANAAKPKASKDDANLPDNIKNLLKGSGNALDGLTIVVTGVPPVMGRKTAEKLVEKYGGKLTKSLSKKTSYVVIGNDAGPTK